MCDTYSFDLDGVLYPYNYSSPRELPGYTPSAVQKVAKCIREEHAKGNGNTDNMKECDVFNDVIELCFGVWFTVWGDERICYPDESSVRQSLDNVIDSGTAFSEILQSSQGRFADLLCLVAEVVYNIHDGQIAQVRQHVMDKFDKLEDDRERETEEAYDCIG